MKYKVLDNFIYGNKAEAKKGSVVELEGDEAKAILKAGLVESMESSQAVEEPKQEEKAVESKPEVKKKGKNS